MYCGQSLAVLPFFHAFYLWNSRWHLSRASLRQVPCNCHGSATQTQHDTTTLTLCSHHGLVSDMSGCDIVLPPFPASLLTQASPFSPRTPDHLPPLFHV